ncbi:MAG: ABC transporter ATP-binding protein, partial [Bacteroidetes bacterium]|nr:ABC transporter ATP-binding protein [Bacteroidota bacterium]
MSRPRTLRAAVPGLNRTLRLVWPYTRRHRGLLGGSFAALFATVGLRVLEPWPLKMVFDRVLMPPQGTSASGENPVMVLLIAGAAVVLITAGRAWMGYLNRVGFALVGNRVLTDVRGALYRHLQCLSLSFHSRTRAGDLVIRVISDIGMLQDVVVTALMPLIGSLLVLVVMAALLITLNLP